MAKRGRKPKSATPTNTWEMAAYYERRMTEIDADEKKALQKFADERETLRAQTPKGILDLVKLKQKSSDAEPPRTDMTEAELEAATAPQVASPTPKAPKPNGKSNGHVNGHQARAEA